MEPRRQRIVKAFEGRVQAIQVANGFATDAGLTVFVGQSVTLGPDDPDVAIAIVVRIDLPRWQGATVHVELPVEIQVLAKSWDLVEAALGDIKRAVELEDRRLGKLVVQTGIRRDTTRTLEREPGATDCGVGITYVAPYVEGWGEP